MPPTPAPDPTPEALAAALALLRTRYPHGFTVDGDGVLSARRGAERVQSLAELLALKSAPKVVRLELAASIVEIEVFALPETAQQEIEKKVPTPVPPMKTRRENGKDVPDGYNTDDPGFKAAVDASYNLRRALTLALAVPVLGVQGETPEAMRDWLLEQKFPVHFLDSLFTAAKSMSEAPVERASFI